jgi:hypothetical protein
MHVPPQVLIAQSYLPLHCVNVDWLLLQLVYSKPQMRTTTFEYVEDVVLEAGRIIQLGNCDHYQVICKCSCLHHKRWVDHSVQDWINHSVFPRVRYR